MGRNSGGNRGENGEKPLEKDSNYKGKVKNIGSLNTIKDPKLFRETKAAIARFDSVMGVRERNVKMADLSGGTMGVQVSMGGQNQAVYLNRKYFQSYNKTRNSMSQMYKDGWQTKTNKPVAHVVTHELGHALWNSSHTSANAKQAGVEIRRLYNKWYADKKKSGYGKYSETNIDEFWAEACTKAVHGTSDKYTNAVKRIVKRYRL